MKGGSYPLHAWRGWNLKRRWLVACFGLVFLLGVIAWYWANRNPEEPTCNGRTLTEWLAMERKSWSGALESSEIDKPAQAVRQIGTNALPLFVKWLRYRPDPHQRRLDALVARLPHWMYYNGPIGWLTRDKTALRAQYALEGISILGKDAESAIPDLVELSKDPLASPYAIPALSRMGKNALPALLDALADPQAPNRITIVNCIGAMQGVGIDAGTALPLLVQCLEDKDRAVARRAADTLSIFASYPNVVVPALEKSLQDTNVECQAIDSLGRLRKSAASVVPSLLKCLNSTNANVRWSATNALNQIAPGLLMKPAPD